MKSKSKLTEETIFFEWSYREKKGEGASERECNVNE